MMGNDREGMIAPGSVDWFPADKFQGYIWGKEDAVIISVIESIEPGRGHLSQLFDAIWKSGRAVHVPTPFDHMQAILEKKGFQQTEVDDPMMGPVEVWIKEAPAPLGEVVEMQWGNGVKVFDETENVNWDSRRVG